MSEIALASSRKVRLELAAKKGSAGAKAALALVHAPNRYFSTGQTENQTNNRDTDLTR